MKRMSAMLLVMLFLLLVGCSAVGTETDYPAAIMAEGTVYLKSVSAMPAEIDESAIIGYTTSYTDTYPEKDGETNFNRELNMPYARVEGGIAVLYENEWYLCTPKDEDAGAGGGTISFYAEPTREGTDPVDFHCSTTVQCTELFLYWLSVFTNHITGGAFRGYGNTQLTFGREILMDRLAQRLNIDPVEFRLMNHVQVGQCFPCASIPVSSNGIEECARRCRQLQREIDEKEPLVDNDEIRQAWGIAFSCHGSGPSSKEGLSGAIIMLNADATVHLLVGSADIGQGSETMECQIAAECLGIPLKSVQITAADTHLTPYNTGTFGSSQTFICGNAVKLACDDLKQKMIEQLRLIYPDCKVEEKEHIYYISGCEESKMNFEEAARKILFDPKGGGPIGVGSYKAAACPNPFAVCFVKAEYHKKLNALRLLDIIQVVDVGTPINRLTVAGQLEGGIAQGVGYALYERMEINPRSRRTLSTDFLHYRIPQMGDMPRTYVDMVSSHDPYGPCGAKSVGELATVPVAPAIVNAARRASGMEISSLPLCDKFVILPTERGSVK